MEHIQKPGTLKYARRDLLGWILSGTGELYGQTGNTNTEIATNFEARNLAASVRDTTLLEVTNSTLGYAYFALINWIQRFFFSKRRCPYIIDRMYLENMKAMF